MLSALEAKGFSFIGSCRVLVLGFGVQCLGSGEQYFRFNSGRLHQVFKPDGLGLGMSELTMKLRLVLGRGFAKQLDHVSGSVYAVNTLM